MERTNIEIKSPYPLSNHDSSYWPHVYRLTYKENGMWRVGCSCGLDYSPEPEYIPCVSASFVIT